MGHVHAVHQTAHGGHEGIVARPEIPVRDCRLASGVADFTLELVEEVRGPADERGDDFEA